VANSRYSKTELPLTLALLAGLTAVGCQTHPKLVDYMGTTVGDPQPFSNWQPDARELAPIIVVAYVERNEIVAKHVEAAHYRGVYLDLHAVRCKVENSLKWVLADTEPTFYYFGDGKYPDSKWIRRATFQAEPGSRYLFFLTRDRDGVLRSIGDVGDYSILISTGAHPMSLTKDRDVGTLISEILLTMGEGADLERTAKLLLQYSRIADVWGSRPLSVQLLRRLLTLPEPLGSQACGVLTAHYLAQEDCIQAVVQNDKLPVELRQRAQAELKEKSGERDAIFQSLKDPAQFGYLDWAGDSQRRLREELETLLFAPDAALHARACTALSRYFPYDSEPKCLNR
jgi:hypothetical protein